MKGYRKLRVKKDTIRKGDFVLEPDGNLYSINPARIGEKVFAKGFYRPIKPKAKKKQPEYIYLKKGDLIQEGDEFYSASRKKWILSCNKGRLFEQDTMIEKYRRKVTKPELKETPLSFKSELKHDLLNILNTSNPDNCWRVKFCQRVAKEALAKIEKV